MTDGLHAASRMLGDVKFHQHGQVDPTVAERWRDAAHGHELAEVTRRLAGALGYELGPIRMVLAAGCPCR